MKRDKINLELLRFNWRGKKRALVVAFGPGGWWSVDGETQKWFSVVHIDMPSMFKDSFGCVHHFRACYSFVPMPWMIAGFMWVEDAKPARQITG